MERPKLRFIEAVPFEQEGQELILLRDAAGVVEQALAVSRDVAFMVSLMDGTRTLRDIQAEFMRTVGEMVYLEHIEDLVRVMEENFFLEGDRYDTYVKELRDEYCNAPVRKAYLAGKGYASNRMELLSFLDEMFDGSVENVVPSGEVAGILAPHIDYERGIKVYREIYPYLRRGAKPLIVIFGTSHRFTEGLWSISLKDFETPLETISCGQGLRELIEGNDLLKRYIDEWPHRSEHSIELQLPLIQFMIQEDFEVLPILTGSMHEYVGGMKGTDDEEVRLLTENLRNVLHAYGKPYCILSGADLAHIGAQFGDRYPLDGMTLESSRQKDAGLLEHIRNVDGDAFFRAIQNEGDSRRICGLTPIFFQLKLLEGCTSDIVSYEQWTDGQSSVSFAGGVFYRR
ncbi:MAG: AmmeMemoRadiSam system protein B [Syntrophorhabdaceae bacterium]|nr:AmmeMemoRadiSam system protein B [Syntrophorhabdaceae bacterium]